MLDLLPIFYERLEVLRQFGQVLAEDSFSYVKDTFEHVVIGILAYICLCVVFYVVTVYIDPSENGQLKSVKRVLFVTAHPDDECMFFGPTILKLTQKKDCSVYLLCLSDGNFDGQGRMRKQELWAACGVLGIPESNVLVVKNDCLPDNPTVRWREEIVAHCILNHLEALSIDTVITFDKLGVSRHQNHASIFYAVAFLCLEKKLPSYCKMFALESINLLRKYSFCLDVPISYILSSYWYIASCKERSIIKSAMRAHYSQYVWFRKLYMGFSRYTFINTLKEVEIVDLELDLDLDD